MVAGHHGFNADLPTLRRRFGVSLRGATLKTIISAAEQIGLVTRALRVELGDLPEVQTPAILHWNLNHFVVLTKVTGSLKGRRYHVNDPGRGAHVLGEAEVSRLFTGVLLELRKGAGFQPQQARSPLRIGQLWSSVSGLGSSMASVLTLSAVLQLISLAMPFYLQLGIDNVLPSADDQLLKMLAIGFGGLALINLLTTWLRSIALLNMTSAFSFQVIDNLCRHLLRLPLSWFEKRHVGDVISRFGSTQPISDFVSQGAVSAVVDGCMGVATLVLMFIYSPLLAGVTLVACVAYAGFKVASFAALRRSNVSSITANARENSAFIETVRGAPTIKAFGQEEVRQGAWQVLKAAAMNAQLKLGRLSAGFEAATGAVLAIERVVFIYLAVGLATKGGFTVGMIFAYQAYKQQFLDAMTRLIDQGVKLRLINVHLTRIADIALSQPEPVGLRQEAEPELTGAIELKDVSFRYGPGDPFVLRSVNLKVEAGEIVALVGPSGGGKTTLIKLMMGLLEPTFGSVLIDGRPLAQIGGRAWRSRIGSVLQEDQLFAGTLAENVSFFDPEINMNQVREACRQAAVLDEIERMPLGLETLVGDMGSSLSGGQRQRVMLARALYREPLAIFMDEGTANLDVRAEAAVLSSIADFKSTRLLCAHSPQVFRFVDHVLIVNEGHVANESVRMLREKNELPLSPGYNNHSF